MSTYLYLTAEKKTLDGWELFAPMQKDDDWESEIVPPLIIDGGWPELARQVINKNKQLGLPKDCSTDMTSFYNQCLKNKGYGIGWSMYSHMKQIKFKDLSGIVEFKSLFSKISNKEKLRLIYWWSY